MNSTTVLGKSRRWKWGVLLILRGSLSGGDTPKGGLSPNTTISELPSTPESITTPGNKLTDDQLNDIAAPVRTCSHALPHQGSAP